MSVMNLVEKTIIKPAKQHITLLLLIIGSLLVFIGTIHGPTIDNWSFVPKGTGDIIQKVGSAILGAGVFAVIMKSAQFTEYFQNSIHEVFYKPETTVSVEIIKQKWEILTRSLLKDTLPASYENASEVIMKRFFNDELQFHFEDFNVSYEFELNPANKKTVSVTHTTTATIVISPNHEYATIKQRLKNGGPLSIKSLLIDDIPVNINNCLTIDPNDPTLRIFELTARPKSILDKKIKMERVYEYQQDITQEPYVIANLERYVKGFVVKAKSTGCKLYFRPTGSESIGNPTGHTDGQNYTRWVLADRNTLLLPGQGYIFVLTI